jgi:hypothetical protein
MSLEISLSTNLRIEIALLTVVGHYGDFAKENRMRGFFGCS